MIREKEEVLVLRDDDPTFGDRMWPERTIIETGQTGIERVDGVVPPITQPARQDRGELVVDQKPHDEVARLADAQGVGRLESEAFPQQGHEVDL